MGAVGDTRRGSSSRAGACASPSVANSAAVRTASRTISRSERFFGRPVVVGGNVFVRLRLGSDGTRSVRRSVRQTARIWLCGAQELATIFCNRSCNWSHAERLSGGLPRGCCAPARGSRRRREGLGAPARRRWPQVAGSRPRRRRGRPCRRASPGHVVADVAAVQRNVGRTTQRAGRAPRRPATGRANGPRNSAMAARPNALDTVRTASSQSRRPGVGTGTDGAGTGTTAPGEAPRRAPPPRTTTGR